MSRSGVQQGQTRWAQEPELLYKIESRAVTDSHQGYMWMRPFTFGDSWASENSLGIDVLDSSEVAPKSRMFMYRM